MIYLIANPFLFFYEPKQFCLKSEDKETSIGYWSFAHMNFCAYLFWMLIENC